MRIANTSGTVIQMNSRKLKGLEHELDKFERAIRRIEYFCTSSKARLGE